MSTHSRKLLLALPILLLACDPYDEPDLLEEPDVYDEIGAVERAVPPVAPPEPEVITFSMIVASPEAWVDKPLAGQFEVTSVPTDRGFWIQHDGERMFVVLIDEPSDKWVDINPGQTLAIQKATLRDSSYLANMPGVPLDEDTKKVIAEQEMFLVIDEADLRITDRPDEPAQ